MASVKSKKKADLKVVILGAANVGKTCFMHRYIEGKFQETVSTIGASFSLKQWGPYNVALWDTAGEERFTGLSSFYCRGAGAAILAFDVTSDDSFHSLRARFLPLLQSAEHGCLVVVVATKTDLLSSCQRSVSQEDGFFLAKELNQSNDRAITDIPYFESSSITGHNVDRVFEYIFEQCLPEDGSPLKRRNPSVVDLENTSGSLKEGEPVKRGCC